MKKTYDITVIGCGLTGLSISLALSSLGFKIAIVDPKPLDLGKRNHHDNRTTALSSGSVDFYKKINVWESIKNNACPIKKILVEENSSSLQSSFNSEETTNNPMGFMIKNNYLLKTLIMLAKKNKNIFKYDDKITKYFRTQKKVLVSLEKNYSIESKLVIGADGRNSFVRKLAKIDYKYKNYNQKAFTFDVEHEKEHNNLAIEKFLEEGPLAILPLVKEKNKNLSSVVWSCNFPNYYQLLKHGNKKIQQVVHGYFKRYYGNIKIISKIKTWDLSLIHSKKYVDHRVLLIGDAAHSIHPLAGQGFNLTIRGIKKLYLCAQKEEIISKDLGKRKYLFKYSKEHFIDASALIFVTDRLNFLFSNSNFLLKGLRRKGLQLFSKNNFIKKVFKNYATKGNLISFKEY